MIALGLLALAQAPAAPAAPAGLVRLDCEVAARGRTARRETWPTSIQFDIAGRRIDSVLLQGPAPFSSFVPVEGPRRLLHRREQWRGAFQKRAIRLRRTGIDQVDLVLEPRAGTPGGFSGFWTHVVTVEQRPIFVEGTIVCRPAVVTVTGTN